MSRDPGHLTELLTFRRPVTAKTASGADSTTYVDDFEEWAEHAPLTQRDREVMSSGQKRSIAGARFVIRRNDNVTARWRLLWNGEEYNIYSAQPLDRQWTGILAERGGP